MHNCLQHCTIKWRHGAQGNGVRMASNQVQYSLLYRKFEKNGMLAAAKELGVSVIAYSPLAQGLLSGRAAMVAGLVSQQDLHLTQLKGSGTFCGKKGMFGSVHHNVSSCAYRWD